MTEKGDLISREALKKAIMYKDNVNRETWEQLYDSVLAEIDNAPTVEQKYYERVIAQINPVIEARPQGKWITKAHSIEYYCSHCGERLDQCCENFCCHCGADMRGDIDG